MSRQRPFTGHYELSLKHRKLVLPRTYRVLGRNPEIYERKEKDMPYLELRPNRDTDGKTKKIDMKNYLEHIGVQPGGRVVIAGRNDVLEIWNPDDWKEMDAFIKEALEGASNTGLLPY